MAAPSQSEEVGVTPVGVGGADEPPQDPEVERLQHREEEAHAQLRGAEERLARADEQRRDGRMVEIAPVEMLGEHMIIGLVVGQLREAGLHEIAEPPHAEPRQHQCVGAECGVSLLEPCFHTGTKIAFFAGFRGGSARRFSAKLSLHLFPSEVPGRRLPASGSKGNSCANQGLCP